MGEARRSEREQTGFDILAPAKHHIAKLQMSDRAGGLDECPGLAIEGRQQPIAGERLIQNFQFVSDKLCHVGALRKIESEHESLRPPPSAITRFIAITVTWGADRLS